MSNKDNEIGNIYDTEKIVAKKVIKHSFRFLLVIILIISLVLILLVSFIKIIKLDDTADSDSDKNSKKWESVGGTTKKKAATLSARGGTVVEKAIECHRYLRENHFQYDEAQLGTSTPEFLTDGRKLVDCGTFVTWVLYECGYDNFVGGQPIYVDVPYGLKQIPNNEVQPGDIVARHGHVEIAAKVDNGVVTLVYNCGGNDSIGAEGTTEYPETTSPSNNNYEVVLRAP